MKCRSNELQIKNKIREIIHSVELTEPTDRYYHAKIEQCTTHQAESIKANGPQRLRNDQNEIFP